MINCSSAIDVSLGYKKYRHSSIRTFEDIKIVFSCKFHNIGYANSHYIVITYIILKITIEYYIYNIYSQLLSMKLY